MGTSGSGKSTFAKKLASRLGVTYLELDKIFWEANWTEPPDSVFFPRLEKALEEHEAWVLDGNYNRTRPIKWKNVDAVIWLDYSAPRVLFQAVRRAFVRSWTQEELWPGTGNRESFRKSFFSKKSIVWWTITTFRKVRKQYEKNLRDPANNHIRFIRLRSQREADQLLETILKNEI